MTIAATPNASADPNSTRQGAPSTGATTPPPRVLELRLSMSPAAAQALNEARVRGLVELEFEDGVLAPSTGGPLGDYVAYVWIDRPNTLQIQIEARVGERPIVRRTIHIGGIPDDVAARLVAIAATEIVRVQAQPARVVRRPPPPKRPSPAELEVAARSRMAVVWSAAGGAALVDGSHVLAGPSAALAFRNQQASERLFARWLAGDADDAGALRWAEIGIGGDYRLWLDSSWRIGLGAVASVASVRLTEARSVDGVTGDRDALSARGAVGLSLEARLTRDLWLGIGFEPGAILRPVRYVDSLDVPGVLEGTWLGADLTLFVERPTRPSR